MAIFEVENVQKHYPGRVVMETRSLDTTIRGNESFVDLREVRGSTSYCTRQERAVWFYKCFSLLHGTFILLTNARAVCYALI